jgi:hypothetical protein
MSGSRDILRAALHQKFKPINRKNNRLAQNGLAFLRTEHCSVDRESPEARAFGPSPAVGRGNAADGAAHAYEDVNRPGVPTTQRLSGSSALDARGRNHRE